MKMGGLSCGLIGLDGWKLRSTCSFCKHLSLNDCSQFELPLGTSVSGLGRQGPRASNGKDPAGATWIQ
eukprot:5529913-Amphidinium_carterae.1